MAFWELMLLAVGLSMDAFAVAICKGLAMDKVTLQRAAVVGLWFGGFQGLMPLLGWLLGVQFQALLKDDLYFDIGRHANDMAFRLRDGFKALGYEFPVPSPSNQQFPVMKIQTAEKLAAMGFEFQVERVIDEEHIMYRFVTSWATPESAIDDLLNALAQCQ